MSALPAAVQKQVDEANEMIDKLSQPAAPPAPETPPAAEGGDPSPAAAPPAASEPPAAPPPAEPPADWQHKYNVLQGKYNAEVPRLTRQVQEQEQTLRELHTQLNNTQSLLASLNPGQSAQTPPAPATPPARLVKDEEIKEFGPDLVDLMRRVSQEAVAGKDTEIAELKQQMAGLGKTVEATANATAVTAEERVIGLLDERVPEWRVQNEDVGFLTWLNEVDPFAGEQRGELLSQAYIVHDAPRVVAIFQGYLNENAAVTPPTPAAAPAGDTPPATPEGQQLESLVAPGTPKAGAHGGAPADHAGKQIWNQSQVTELYAKINEFTKKGRPAPKALQDLEADLILAQAEGRIQT